MQISLTISDNHPVDFEKFPLDFPELLCKYWLNPEVYHLIILYHLLSLINPQYNYPYKKYFYLRNSYALRKICYVVNINNQYVNWKEFILYLNTMNV